MDNHQEIKHSFLGGSTILLLEGFFWILAAILGSFVSPKIGILLIIVVGTFFYPLSLLFHLILKRPKVSSENPLNGLFMQIGLIIPFSFPLIFLITKENPNLFFPVLTIVVGAHYLPFVYAYKLKTYWVLSSLLVVGGSYFGFMLPEYFEYCAYYTGALLLIFAVINYHLTQKENFTTV